MKLVGPEITVLTHRLAECPPDCYETPLGPRTRNKSVALDVIAIVSDHFRDLGIELDAIANPIELIGKLNARQQRMVLIATWLLRDPWLMENSDAALVSALLTRGLTEMAEVVVPESTITDPDRREELARICLRELGMRPSGETEQQALDRLNTLDSAERVRVISKTRAAEARARKIREAMAKKAAEEAAARYSPE
jgi:hypothetical protein